MRPHPVRNNAATTALRSWTRTLYVRHAAGVSMISRPIPWAATSLIRSVCGRVNDAPVPTMMTSGSSAMAVARSASSRFSGSDTAQSCNTSSAERIRLLRTHSSPIRTAPDSQAAMRLASDTSRVNLIFGSRSRFRWIISGTSGSGGVET